MKGSPTKFFGTVRKSISDKIVIHHLMQFFQDIFFLKHKDPPTKILGTVRQKICDTKSWSPFFCIKSFHTTKFLKHRILPLRNFPALWDKKISTVLNDNPLLSFKISDTRIFLRDRKSPYENFLYCEKSNFRQIRDTPSCAIFFWSRKILKQKSPPTFFFGTARRKNCHTKSWSPLLCIESFDTRNFSTVINDNPLLSVKISDTRIFLRDRESPTNFFGTVRKTTFDKIVIHHLMQFS